MLLAFRARSPSIIAYARRIAEGKIPQQAIHSQLNECLVKSQEVHDAKNHHVLSATMLRGNVNLKCPCHICEYARRALMVHWGTENSEQLGKEG